LSRARVGHLLGVDEHRDTFTETEDQDSEEREERFDRPLTQRELVRASLLRCPPPEPAQPPRR
jgi:hypothetical protein